MKVIPNEILMTNTISMILNVAIYGLIIYQTYILNRKRKKAINIISD